MTLGRALPAFGGLSFALLAVLAIGLVTWGNLSGASPVAPTLQSSLGPTDPDGTQAAESLAPTAAPTVLDRAGVPAALHDQYYVGLSGFIGQVGTTAIFQIPSGECVLGAGAGLVATTPCASDTFEPSWGPDGITIVVRDYISGGTVRTLQAPVFELGSLMIDSRLFIIGRTGPLEDPGSIDAGVWLVDLAEPAPTARAVVAAADLSEEFGEHGSRGALSLTDRGQAVTTQLVGDTKLVTQVLDLQTLETRTLDYENEATIGVVDGMALTILPHELGGSRARGVRLVEIETGRVLAYVEADFAKGGVVIGDYEVFLQVSQNQVNSVVLAIDLKSGKVREIRRMDNVTETLDMSAFLSTPEAIALVPAAGPAVDPEGRMSLPVSLLDTTTGVVTPEAFVLP